MLMENSSFILSMLHFSCLIGSLFLTHSFSPSFLFLYVLHYPLYTFFLLKAGSLADIVGRKVIFVATAALITLGSIGSACSFESSYMTVYGHIACWRFLLGMFLSLCLCVCLCACVSFCLSAYLSVYMSVYLHESLSVHVSVRLSSMSQSNCTSYCSCVCTAISPSFPLSLSLSPGVYICAYLSLILPLT